ncbi:MAG TPA: methionine gamma-lyase family protein, partial [Chroococcales cyanobacterium]
MPPLSPTVDQLINSAETALSARFKEIDQVAETNQKRVLEAFRKNRLTEEFFAERTGYGRNDAGRETIDNIFADVFEAEAAAVRMQFVSGTHAIACALLGNVAPGQYVLSLTGEPYDTMKEVIGTEGE